MDVRQSYSEALLERIEQDVEQLPDLPGCWLWTGATTARGYGGLTFRGRGYAAHRAVVEATRRAPIPAGLHVLHRCDVPCCVRPDHLALGTRADNMRDMRAKGRAPVFRHRGPSLVLEDYARIRRMLAAGESPRAVAEQLGVSPKTIRDIRAGRNLAENSPRFRRRCPRGHAFKRLSQCGAGEES